MSESSIVVATGSECAAAQGKFWEYHDLIYGESYSFDPSVYDYDLILEFATDLDLRLQEFESCMLDGEGFAKVQASHMNAVSLGVDSTPTLRVNDKWVNSYDALNAAIDLEISESSDSIRN